MAKYIELAERLAAKYGEEMMCALIGRMSDEQINSLINETE